MKITIDMSGIFDKDKELKRQLKYLVRSALERKVKKYLDSDGTLNRLAKETAQAMSNQLRELK